MGFDHDLQVLQATFRLQIHLDDDAKERLHLVGNLLEQPMDIVHPNDLAAVVPVDREDAALSVGKSADSLQVLFVPGRFPFDILRFTCHGHRRLPCCHREWAGGWNQ